ncbi:hypothetical protein BV494_01775 [Rahnella sikkimica]|uniref:Uncharacterized protein n=1 Tax=Rahnella sikkimica TaxID=1805933 RepID=A0A2L1ULB3_9GAMM|nr:hypothetical protein BV494_01775 [Rahnella sikkimica]
MWRYRWNAQNRLCGLITPDGERWQYAYDAFGRRISKRREGGNGNKPAGYDYLWSGDQLIEETPVYADGTPAGEESIHWLYEPGALTPLARSEKGQLHYVVSDHLGTPRELLTEKGDVAWANRLSTWGKETRYRLAANDDRPTCNLRFAGQYADEESGLHYNRHRYYDSETGQYLSPDPIGLAGGLNPYGYVHNPLSWVDPLGLACCPPKFYSRNEAFRAAKRDAGVPMGQQPSKVDMVNLTDRNGHNILGEDYKPIKTREYTFTRPGKEDIIIQDHSPGHIYGPDGTPGNQGSHINVRPKSDTRNGQIDGTLEHYPF